MAFWIHYLSHAAFPLKAILIIGAKLWPMRWAWNGICKPQDVSFWVQIWLLQELWSFGFGSCVGHWRGKSVERKSEREDLSFPLPPWYLPFTQCWVPHVYVFFCGGKKKKHLNWATITLHITEILWYLVVNCFLEVRLSKYMCDRKQNSRKATVSIFVIRILGMLV